METRNYVFKSKRVRDFSGFWTDYTWWIFITLEEEKIEHCFILGDIDIYDPGNSDADNFFDNYKEALEWWEDIDEDYFFDEEDLFDHDLEDTFELLMGEE